MDHSLRTFPPTGAAPSEVRTGKGGRCSPKAVFSASWRVAPTTIHSKILAEIRGSPSPSPYTFSQLPDPLASAFSIFFISMLFHLSSCHHPIVVPLLTFSLTSVTSSDLVSLPPSLCSQPLACLNGVYSVLMPIRSQQAAVSAGNPSGFSTWFLTFQP